MEDPPDADRVRATVIRHPWTPEVDERPFMARPIFLGATSHRDVPTPVSDWTFFGGAVAALAEVTQDRATVWGSAFLIAPGVALTATHTYRGWLEALEKNHSDGLLVAPRSQGVCDLWKLRGAWHDGEYVQDDFEGSWYTGDVSCLSVALVSDWPDDWELRVLPLSPRAPEKDEVVRAYGFQVGELDAVRVGTEIKLLGDMYCAEGDVIDNFPEGRGKARYPASEVRYGTLGGMSGGPVIDANGYVVGVASRGWQDPRPPSTFSWLHGALDLVVRPGWPPGVEDLSIRILDFKHGLGLFGDF